MCLPVPLCKRPFASALTPLACQAWCHQDSESSYENIRHDWDEKPGPSYAGLHKSFGKEGVHECLQWIELGIVRGVVHRMVEHRIRTAPRGPRVCRVHRAQCLVYTLALSGTMLDRLPKQWRDAPVISDIYVSIKGKGKRGKRTTAVTTDTPGVHPRLTIQQTLRECWHERTQWALCKS